MSKGGGEVECEERSESEDTSVVERRRDDKHERLGSAGALHEPRGQGVPHLGSPGASNRDWEQRAHNPFHHTDAVLGRRKSGVPQAKTCCPLHGGDNHTWPPVPPPPPTGLCTASILLAIDVFLSYTLKLKKEEEEEERRKTELEITLDSKAFPPPSSCCGVAVLHDKSRVAEMLSVGNTLDCRRIFTSALDQLVLTCQLHVGHQDVLLHLLRLAGVGAAVAGPFVGPSGPDRSPAVQVDHAHDQRHQHQARHHEDDQNGQRLTEVQSAGPVQTLLHNPVGHSAQLDGLRQGGRDESRRRRETRLCRNGKAREAHMPVFCCGFP
ncbi:hypothetical protein EYF80_003788 [Liparis tanakae]|uniref:Uncharacterized protein n=1 Tax=Liparis tanakae TaxID=230148 RepID=A0A4Z2J7R1_9TELE|nr:hypothetical protein EYF80_003788 [Liparis tanakae]